MNKVSDNLYYVGANDHQIDLFEGQYKVPKGMAYNSYVIMDNEITVMDTIDIHFTDEWLANIAEVLGDRKPSYLVVQHMEPDHSASIEKFLSKYPDTVVVASAKAFTIMEQFFREMPLPEDKRHVVNKDGDSLCIGTHTLNFITAPMVHWPEVIMTYLEPEKALFSADGFGKFGALDEDEPWDDEARRYYIGIVGKYGRQVQNVLKKAATLDISLICPLHGPVLKSDLGHYISLYDTWSSYRPEKKGVALCYTSIYGNTKKAALLLESELKADNVEVKTFDLARCDMAEAIAMAFCYDKLALCSTTYNNGLYPFMDTFLNGLKERGFNNRKIAIIENGSWAPIMAANVKEKLDPLQDISYFDTVTIRSSMSKENEAEIGTLALEMSK